MGKKHYSGKELILRRRIEQQQQERKELGTNNRMTYTLRQANQIKAAVESARKKMREKKNDGISD